MATQPLPSLMPNAAMRWDVVSRLLPERIESILEVGCGQGAVAARLARRTSRLVALEPDPTSCAVAKARVGDAGTVLNIASTALPPDEAFDLVCAFEVIEHIEDDRAALEDWISRLKPGGRLVLSAPAHSARFAAADEVAGHFRRYDRADMQALLEGAGLEDVQVRLYGHYGGRILEAGRNYLARKAQARGASSSQIEDRTAESGRMFQPSGALQQALMNGVAWGAVRFQRLFPDRGVGLVATARKPR